MKTEEKNERSIKKKIRMSGMRTEYKRSGAECKNRLQRLQAVPPVRSMPGCFYNEGKGRKHHALEELEQKGENE